MKQGEYFFQQHYTSHCWKVCSFAIYHTFLSKLFHCVKKSCRQLLKFCSSSSRSSRSSSRVLWQTSHLRFAQQSLTMCQQGYSPYARAENDCGKLVSTGKLMSDVVKHKHSDRSTKLSLKCFFPLLICSRVENINHLLTRTSTNTAKPQGEVFHCCFFIFYIRYMKI